MAFEPFPALPNRGRHIREYALVTDEDYAVGAAIVFNAGEIEEAGANPSSILGFAAEESIYEDGEDFNPGRRLVFVAEANSTFWMSIGELDSPDIVEVDVAESMIGDTFGITEHTDSGIWYVDNDKDAANQRVIVEDIDERRNLVEVRVLAANRVLG